MLVESYILDDFDVTKYDKDNSLACNLVANIVILNACSNRWV